MTNKTWKPVSFENILDADKRRTNRVIGLSFPENNASLGLEPSILTVLPDGDNVEFSPRNIDFNDQDVLYYVCSVYISGMDEFKEWSSRHDRSKIVVGGYHPTTFPEEFTQLAAKVVTGPCDDFYSTIEQEGQVVKGITGNHKMPRYDLYDVGMNQQIIPGKHPDDVVVSINTSQGCPYRCDFCCTPIMSPKLCSKPIELVAQEADYLKQLNPKWLFIRDENFPLQKDWRQRLELIAQTGANIYLFASANILDDEKLRFMKANNVYMICLGLEDPTAGYKKNENLFEVTRLMKKHGIYSYLSFIVDPTKIVGVEEGKAFYGRLNEEFERLEPEMVCGNFLMPFRGTGLWDKYYHMVAPEDYKHYDSKTPFLIRNPVVREKMKFFMFWHQWQYYTSDFYNQNVREFAVGDTLHLRFQELYDDFIPKYERLWDIRA